MIFSSGNWKESQLCVSFRWIPHIKPAHSRITAEHNTLLQMAQTCFDCTCNPEVYCFHVCYLAVLAFLRLEEISIFWNHSALSPIELTRTLQDYIQVQHSFTDCPNMCLLFLYMRPAVCSFWKEYHLWLISAPSPIYYTNTLQDCS